MYHEAFSIGRCPMTFVIFLYPIKQVILPITHQICCKNGSPSIYGLLFPTKYAVKMGISKYLWSITFQVYNLVPNSKTPQNAPAQRSPHLIAAIPGADLSLHHRCGLARAWILPKWWSICHLKKWWISLWVLMKIVNSMKIGHCEKHCQIITII